MAVRGASGPLDPRALLAEYPYLAGGELALGDDSPSVGSLLEDAAYEQVRATGRARIRAALEDPRGEQEVRELSNVSADVRYLSFLFARIVLSAAPSAAGLRRWAVAEAKRSYARLARAPSDELEEVGARLQFPIARSEGKIALGVADYVRLSAPIREADFRLARQDVLRGRVFVAPIRAARLLQEAARRALSDPLPLSPEVVARVRAGEAELLDEVVRRLPAPVARAGGGLGGILPDRFPPCIRKMQRTLQQGENLSHAGRFALAAFLHRVGANEETIVDAYRGAPDFDESVTRYQVEHITQRDGGLGYEPPTCDSLRSHGLCAREGDPDAPDARDRGRDGLCFEEFLRHPLQYYRTRGGTTRERGGDESHSPTPAGRATGSYGGPGRTRSIGPR